MQYTCSNVRSSAVATQVTNVPSHTATRPSIITDIFPIRVPDILYTLLVISSTFPSALYFVHRTLRAL